MDPDCIDKDGNAPLHLAARCGFDSVAREILKGGATLNLKNKVGKTARDLLPSFMEKTDNVFTNPASMSEWVSKVNLLVIETSA
jgi:hypothetical protein